MFLEAFWFIFVRLPAVEGFRPGQSQNLEPKLGFPQAWQGTQVIWAITFASGLSISRKSELEAEAGLSSRHWYGMQTKQSGVLTTAANARPYGVSLTMWMGLTVELWRVQSTNHNSLHSGNQPTCQPAHCLQASETSRRNQRKGRLSPPSKRWSHSANLTLETATLTLLSSRSPSCLHLAPQQQSVLGRLFLFVVLSFHTDILDLRVKKEY